MTSRRRRHCRRDCPMQMSRRRRRSSRPPLRRRRTGCSHRPDHQRPSPRPPQLLRRQPSRRRCRQHLPMSQTTNPTPGSHTQQVRRLRRSQPRLLQTASPRRRRCSLCHLRRWRQTPQAAPRRLQVTGRCRTHCRHLLRQQQSEASSSDKWLSRLRHHRRHQNYPHRPTRARA